MKRDTQHMDRVLAAVRSCWEQYPEQRLMQLLDNAMGESDAFYVEDEDAEQRLGEYTTIDWSHIT